MIVLVAGPESTGTRIAAQALSQHPDVTGVAGGHEDPLDDFWNGSGALPKDESEVIYLTRRSIPAARPGEAAEYMQIPGFGRLIGSDVRVVVTSRSPSHALRSSVKKRASVSGDWQKAWDQYQAAYKILFDHINKAGWPFVITSIEGFVNDNNYTEGVCECIGLRPFKPEGITWRAPN